MGGVFLIAFFNQHKEREIVSVKSLKWNFCNDVSSGKDINTKFVVSMNLADFKESLSTLLHYSFHLAQAWTLNNENLPDIFS